MVLEHSATPPVVKWYCSRCEGSWPQAPQMTHGNRCCPLCTTPETLVYMTLLTDPPAVTPCEEKL